MNNEQRRKNTPETAAKTQTERVKQILKLQEQLLLEEKANREQINKPYDPNAIMKDDKIPF